jgi:hypothetical protein
MAEFFHQFQKGLVDLVESFQKQLATLLIGYFAPRQVAPQWHKYVKF